MFEGLGPRRRKATSTCCSKSAGGSNNGSTNNDRTNYFVDLPSNALELALFLDSDRMAYLLDSMSPAKVDGQRDVVKNERRQGVENRPVRQGRRAAARTALPQGPPVPLADHRLHGRPHRGELRRRGGVLQEVLRAEQRERGASPGTSTWPARARSPRSGSARRRRATPVPPVAAPPAMLTGVTRKVVTDAVQLPRLTLAWLSPARFAPGRRRARRRRRRCSVAARTRGSTSGSSTNCRSRRTCQRLPGLGVARLHLPDRGDGAAGPRTARRRSRSVDRVQTIVDEETREAADRRRPRRASSSAPSTRSRRASTSRSSASAASAGGPIA